MREKRICLILRIFMTIIFLSLPMKYACAGMPSIVLSKEVMSHFVGISTAAFVILVIAALLIRYSWNTIFSDMQISRLSYKKSIGIAFLGGLLFLLVLVMIAGSRELLTPGAWKPRGNLYVLADAPRDPNSVPAFDPKTFLPTNDLPESLAAARYGALFQLRGRLLQYRQEHDNRWPADRKEAGFNADLWIIPASGGLNWLYSPNDKNYIVRQPDLSDGPLFFLDRQGLIHEMPDFKNSSDSNQK